MPDLTLRPWPRALCLLAVLSGCPDKNGGDTDSDTGTTAATDPTTTDATTDAPTGGTTDAPNSGCMAPTGAKADFSVAWGVADPPCGPESCSVDRDGTCTVSAVGLDAAKLALTLDCEHDGVGPSTDVVTLDVVDPAIDLAVGDSVDLTYRERVVFEDQPDLWLRLVDADGLVLAVGSGGAQGDPEFGQTFLDEVANPFSAEFVAGCDDASEDLTQLEFSHAGVTVAVPETRWSTLAAEGHTWLLDVKQAAAASADPWFAQLEFAIVRLDPAAEMP
ncbi:hypothetical protein OV090_25610 [Nannocystis sp. RBIL2]|uniref:hypothetical protein n=1 Tax=Nannocystis sp. RBIL2 TaxID=2996788 RepID=UPI002271D6B0|nr:hypothetical protein [Nannocystis sp. RBIL2]MCY1068146.1 hypothetical protein [Nannocystis sp. RBIL2]